MSEKSQKLAAAVARNNRKVQEEQERARAAEAQLIALAQQQAEQAGNQPQYDNDLSSTQPIPRSVIRDIDTANDPQPQHKLAFTILSIVGLAIGIVILVTPLSKLLEIVPLSGEVILWNLSADNRKRTQKQERRRQARQRWSNPGLAHLSQNVIVENSKSGWEEGMYSPAGQTTQVMQTDRASASQSGIAGEEIPHNQPVASSSWQRRVDLLPSRPPPQKGKPKRPVPDKKYTGFAARLYGVISLICIVLWIVLAQVLSRWHIYWWISLAVAIAAWILAELLYARAVIYARQTRRKLLAANYDKLDTIRWPAKVNQGMPDWLLWRMMYTMRSGTHLIRHATRSNRWQLVRKFRHLIKLGVCVLLLTALAIVCQKNHWLPAAAEQRLGYAYLGLAVSAFALVASGCYLAMDWIFWGFIGTDEWMHVNRPYPIWFPWKDSFPMAVSFASIAGASPKEQYKSSRFGLGGNILGYGRVAIDEVQVEDSNPSKQADSSGLQFKELRFITRNQDIAAYINDELDRNKNEELVQQTRAADIAEEAAKINQRQLAAQEKTNQLLVQMLQNRSQFFQ